MPQTKRRDVMKRHSFAASLALAAGAVLGLAGPVAADELVPFRGRFAGVGTTISVNLPIVSGITNGTGNATQLGQFTYQQPHSVNLATSTLIGSYHFTAANGAELFADFIGRSSATPTPGVRYIVETATVRGGTGRFAGATGSFTVKRLINMARTRSRSPVRSTGPSPPLVPAGR
jgi:hypothetical protein